VNTRDVAIPDWAKPAILALLIFLFPMVVLAIGMLYWGDQYASPAWDEHSVPPPMAY
jgi:hypothetical protein